MAASIDEAEDQRVAELHALDLLHTPPEERFDRVTRLAQRLFNVQTAALNLVDSEIQWTKSFGGKALGQLPREQSFCTHAIQRSDVLEVHDATQDPVFRDNPLVTGDPHIRFYAGTPVHGPSGKSIGAFCLIDPNPRQLDDADLALLRELGDWLEREVAVADELQRARDIARGVLPRQAPQLQGWEVEGRSITSSGVAGDFYDWDVRNGVALLTFAEVEGTGMDAAAAVATLRIVMRVASGELDQQVQEGLSCLAEETSVQTGRILRARLAADGLSISNSGCSGITVRADGTVACLGTPVESGDWVAIFSDGYADLRGGVEAAAGAIRDALRNSQSARAALDSLLPAQSVDDDASLLLVRRV